MFGFRENPRLFKICIDEAFFNRNWAGVCWGRWAGIRAVVDWFAGSGATLLCKDKREEGSPRASPVAALMPKSVPRWEKR